MGEKTRAKAVSDMAWRRVMGDEDETSSASGEEKRGIESDAPAWREAQTQLW